MLGVNNLVLCLSLALSVPLWGASNTTQGALSPPAERAVREAENLSLQKDRLPACTALIRTIKKSDKSDQKILKEKLNQLSRYFYTDKGYQNFVEGKDLFDKQKFSDALEKFIEADDLENGNIEILNFQVLCQLWLKNPTGAETLLEKALQINPFDVDILKDKLLTLLASERWNDVVKDSDVLLSVYGDSATTTLMSRAVALSESGSKTEATKIFNQVVQKDPLYPEALYWNGVLTDNGKNLSNYLELCDKKPIRFISRDLSTCSHVTDAKKRQVNKGKPTPSPSSSP